MSSFGPGAVMTPTSNLVPLAPITVGTLAFQVDLAKSAIPVDRVLLDNESPYMLELALGGGTFLLMPGQSNVFPTAGASQLGVTPILLTSRPVPAAACTSLLVTLVPQGEVVPGVYPMSSGPALVGAYDNAQSLGTVVATTGLATTKTFPLPDGTQAVAFKTNQNQGFSGTASLSLNDSNGDNFATQNPVTPGQWAFAPVVLLADNILQVKLDATGVTTGGTTLTATIFALPFLPAVGVTTFSGASVAIRSGASVGISSFPSSPQNWQTDRGADASANSAPAAGTGAVLAFGALSGLRYVIATLIAAIFNTGGAASSLNVRVWDGASGSTLLAKFPLSAAAGGQDTRVIPMWKLQGSIFTTMTIDTDLAPAAVAQYLDACCWKSSF